MPCVSNREVLSCAHSRTLICCASEMELRMCSSKLAPCGVDVCWSTKFSYGDGPGHGDDVVVASCCHLQRGPPVHECGPTAPYMVLLLAIGHLHLRSGSDESSQTPLQPYGALLLDIGGTLLETSQPVPEVYARIGAKYGVKATAADIKKGFKKAFSEPWPERLRYEGDGRPFWRYAVAIATSCPDETYFEELYQHFARGDAWKLANGAPEALTRLRNAGVKLAVVSNFDSRLRPILRDLRVDTLFDALIISAEIGYEKPSPEIFEAALNELCVDAKVAVHVGDDPANDKQGALAAGLESWLWKVDVTSFEELADRILQPATRTVR